MRILPLATLPRIQRVLADTVETYFDSRLDLLQRRMTKHSDRLKMKAQSKFNDVFKKDVFKLKSVNGDLLTDNLDREMQKFKLRVRCALSPTIPVADSLYVSQMNQRVTSLAASWQSAKIVRTREKVTFFGGVMSLLITALLFGMRPEYVCMCFSCYFLSESDSTLHL